MSPKIVRTLSLLLGFSTALVFGESAPAPRLLPSSGIFPQGRTLAYMGYSGDPERDLANGFTVAGPAYGDQAPYLQRCFSSHWPVVAHIGLHVKFTDPRSPPLPPVRELRRLIEEQVLALAGHKEIVWWAITPEELRPWKPDEMNYLRTVCEVIRANDPLHRPIYLYNPNHRDAQSLAPIAQEVDIVAKGCYVNTTGHAQQRAWVQWSVDQEIGAIRAAGRPGAIPLLNLEMCKDPAPSDDGQIRAWVRHDVYLGLVSGAKGVLIWSLYPRNELRRTWGLWYNAYAECGRELNGPRGLAQVFLFGKPSSELKVIQVAGEAVVPVHLGGKVEAATTSKNERVSRQTALPASTAAEYSYGPYRWLFIVSSASTPCRFTVSGWPAGTKADDGFTGQSIALPDTALSLNVPPNGVLAVRFTPPH